MIVMRSSIFEVGMLLVLIIKLDNDISTAYITETTPRLATSTKANKVCNETDTPANGNISYSNASRVVGTTVTYTCDVGNELHGTNSRTCTMDGTWDGADPICKLKVHEYNDLCIESGPDGQCSSVDARCLIDGDGTGYRCRCTNEDYYHQANDSCLKRPVAPKNMTLLIDLVETNSLIVWWTAANENKHDYDVVVVWKSSCSNTVHTYNKTWRSIGNGKEFGGLESGTKYTFFLYLEKDSIRTILLDTVSVYTKPEPVQTMRFEEVWEKNFTIVWDNDPARPCKSYTISLNTGEQVTLPRTNDTSQSYTFTNLTGGTSYVVRITAEVPGQLSETLSKTSYTSPVAPKNMTLLIDSVKTNSLFVWWTAANENNHDYDVVVVWKSSCSNTVHTYNKTWRSIGNGKEFEGLESGTEYTFFLYLEKDSIRTILLDTVSVYTKPEPVQTLHFEDVWEKNFTVVWNNDPARLCKSYIISLDTGKRVTIPRTNDTSQSYTFTNLTGGTSYVVTITAEVQGQLSEPLSKTSYTRPKPVINATVKQVFSNAITLQLTTGPGVQNDDYKIYVTPNRSDAVENPITSTHDAVKIGGLELGKEYTFKVYTYYQDLESERCLTMSAYTRPMPPGDLTVHYVLEDSLQLYWTLPESNSFDKYILEYRTVDSKDVKVSLQFNKTLAMPRSVQPLTPGTSYVFNLYTVINGVRSETPATVSAFTRPDGPEMPTFKQRFGTSIVIEFPSNVNSYNAYQINGKVYERGNDTITITDLNPGMDYTFTIFTVANFTVSSLNNTTFDSFTRPTYPTAANFPVGDLHETILTVTWDAVTNGNVDGYLVFLSNDNNKMSFNGSIEITTATFSNLTTGTQYTANIYSYWRGVLSYNSLERTMYTRPTAPIGHISHVTESTLTLAFAEPGVGWPNFMIKVRSVSNSEPCTINVSLDEIPYEIDALTAGTNYTVEVYSIADIIVGENALILSSYTKPEAVRSDTITADPSLTNSSVLAIQWAKPTEGSVDWYEMQYECTGPNDQTSMVPNYTNQSYTTTSTVSGLDPGTVCTVNITSHIGNQHGTPTQKRIDWNTDENAPEKVQDMHVETGPRNLTVTWNSPLAPNGSIRKYRVDVVDLKENCIISQTIYTCRDCRESSNPQCGQDVSSQVSTLGLCDNASDAKPYLETKGRYELRVPDLHPYRNYTVKITPFTRCYGTPVSVSKITKQGAPSGVPINVTQSMPETTNNTLSLIWYSPLEDKQNGIITEYTVYIKYNDRTCYGEPKGNEVKKQIAVNSTFGESLNSVAIPNLYPFWSYSIAVSASTVAGEGPNTDEVRMVTNQSPPDVIRSSPHVTDKSSSSVDLEWEHPCYVNGIIKCYQIHVVSLDDQDTVKVFETQTNETRDIISDLKPYHNYTVSVAAINTDNETGPALNTTGILRTSTEESKEYISQGASTGTIVVAFICGIGITLVAVGVVIYLKRRRVVCFAQPEENDTHGVSETIPGTEMVTKTSVNKVLRSPSEEDSNPYDVIGNHQDEERSAYYNIDRNHYDVLERSNDQFHEYGTLVQNGANTQI